tara:strand:+ start:60 stop:464 length:405 start_codon:yes stop_codon:yes gene_type:complete
MPTSNKETMSPTQTAGGCKMMVTFYAIVALHMFVIIGNVLAFFISPFLAPWYEALPICSFILLISFSQELKCPLTRLENSIRVKLGKKRIGGFIGHYFLRPVKYYLKKPDRKRLNDIKLLYRYALGVVANFIKF